MDVERRKLVDQDVHRPIKLGVPDCLLFSDALARGPDHRLIPSQDLTCEHSRHGLRGRSGCWTWKAGPRHALGGVGIDGTILVMGRGGGFWRMAFPSPRQWIDPVE